MADLNYTIKFSVEGQDKVLNVQSKLDKTITKLIRLTRDYTQVLSNNARIGSSSYNNINSSLTKIAQTQNALNRLTKLGFNSTQIQKFRAEILRSGVAANKLATAMIATKNAKSLALTGMTGADKRFLQRISGGINKSTPSNIGWFLLTGGGISALRTYHTLYNKLLNTINTSTLRGKAFNKMFDLQNAKIIELRKNIGILAPMMDKFGGFSLKSVASGLVSIAGPAIAAAATLKLVAESIKFTVLSIKAFELSLKLTKKLNAVLKATGNTVGFTATQLDKFADDLSMKIGMDDLLIKQNLITPLLAFLNVSGEVFTRAIQLAADMNAVMGGEGVIKLGKALLSPTLGITGLTRKGIIFTLNLKKKIKTLELSNRIYLAQMIILDKLSNKFNGAALAAATMSDKIKVSNDKLKLSFGLTYYPLITALSTVVIKLNLIVGIIIRNRKYWNPLSAIGALVNPTPGNSYGKFAEEGSGIIPEYKLGAFLSNKYSKNNSTTPAKNNITTGITDLQKAMGYVSALSALIDYKFDPFGEKFQAKLRQNFKDVKTLFEVKIPLMYDPMSGWDLFLQIDLLNMKLLLKMAKYIQPIVSAADNLSQAFADMIFNGANFGKAMQNIFKQLLIDITAMLVRMAVLQGIFLLLGGTGTKIGNVFGIGAGLITKGVADQPITSVYNSNNAVVNRLERLLTAIYNTQPKYKILTDGQVYRQYRSGKLQYVGYGTK